MCALQNHVMDALQSTGKILRPFHIVRNLRCISRNFRNSRQEDAHEYMVNLLESMHKCCLPSGVQSESPSAYEKSLVHKIFGGQLRSQVKCKQCSYCSNKFDPFLDLSLEIVRADSLKKAFAHFTAMEQLDGGERQYQCQRCNKKVQAFKQLTIHKAPYVLTIHLKRFGSGVRGEKINKKIEFEPTLDVRPFFSGVHEGELKYTLYGVLVHAGWSTHSGHYFCYVRTSAGLWYSLDDNHVSQVSEKTVLSREAYMLFYVRDRTYPIKPPVQVNLNANISANANICSTGNKEAPVMEKRSITAVCSSANASHDSIVHDHTTNKNFCLGVNGDVSTNRLRDTVLPTNKAELRDSVKSKLPFGAKNEDVNKSTLNNIAQQKMETNLKSSGIDDRRPLSPMQQNRKIRLRAEGGLYFGRKCLLFMSLRLRKKKKKKKTKVQHQNSRNKIKRRAIDTADVDSMNSTSGKKSKRRKYVESGDDYSQMNDEEINRSCINGDKSRASKRSSGSSGCAEGQQNVKVENVEDEKIIENYPVSLLKERLKETPVARWDAEDLPAPQINEMEDPPKRNIGYMLDEWDEEFDRGKRKKIKSRQWYDGPNPFQKTADFKTQQRMMKEPLRI
ncbi:ubiquitin carboxyl-terminal hydrolase 23-like [Phalaenopsis equestris]|uniref:ubiquitin carboxyl-terminal hydrolase 23-like n=1 Tax=Phalaenopsis equestris TaxID=78828 RepID=UPI0009E1A980|nr:ubiquitin carboxyl-terminal hydrolase 23-like [Phalaenopsis equestris]